MGAQVWVPVSFFTKDSRIPWTREFQGGYTVTQRDVNKLLGSQGHAHSAMCWLGNSVACNHNFTIVPIILLVLQYYKCIPLCPIYVGLCWSCAWKTLIRVMKIWANLWNQDNLSTKDNSPVSNVSSIQMFHSTIIIPYNYTDFRDCTNYCGVTSSLFTFHPPPPKSLCGVTSSLSTFPPPPSQSLVGCHSHCPHYSPSPTQIFVQVVIQWLSQTMAARWVHFSMANVFIWQQHFDLYFVEGLVHRE